MRDWTPFRCVVRNKDLSLWSVTEIKNELKITKCYRHQKNHNQKIEPFTNPNTYILTFNHPKPPPEIKIGYTLAKVEKYIANPSQKVPQLSEIWTFEERKPVCIKCSAHEPDNGEDSCTNNLNCCYCNESHTVQCSGINKIPTKVL